MNITKNKTALPAAILSSAGSALAQQFVHVFRDVATRILETGRHRLSPISVMADAVFTSNSSERKQASLRSTLDLVSGTSATLPGSLYSRLASYRYKVFIEALGWELKTEVGREQDQFDRDDTVYVVACDSHGRINGCARLLPTVRPYLLGEVFPQLLNGAPIPSDPDVWELSRFAAVDFDQDSTSPLAHSNSPVAEKLLREAIRCAAARGAKRLIAVTRIGSERLLRRGGFTARRAGPPTIVDGHPLVACWIDVDAALRF